MALRRKNNTLNFIVIGVAFIMGVFLYKNVLPYHFSHQWEANSGNLNTTGAYDSKEEKGVFLGKEVKSQDISETAMARSSILGETDASNKRIEVDLANQRVYAFEGNKVAMSFIVSTGKWGRTPTGTFKIAYKTRAQKMSGGNQALGTYYYLPNVQYVQFFGNSEIPWSRGFSFHGTYWHENFGTPMSHGCVNMRNEDAQALYYWTNPAIGDSRVIKATAENEGTTVIIYGETPRV